MEIDFSAKTNKDYCMINKAFFETKDGQTVGIDRLHTGYDISENGTLEMSWSECYLWEIDGENPFDSEDMSMLVYNDRMLSELLDGARFKYLELEDDTDADYEVTDISVEIVSSSAKKSFTVKTRGGILTAEAGMDPDNPGVSVCYMPDGGDTEVDVVYIENTDPGLPSADGNKAGDLQIMVYDDPWIEDYINKFVLKDEDVRSALDPDKE